MANTPSEDVLKYAREVEGKEWSAEQGSFVPAQSAKPSQDVLDYARDVEGKEWVEEDGEFQPVQQTQQPEPTLDERPVSALQLDEGMFERSVGYLEGIADGIDPEVIAFAAEAENKKYDGQRKMFVPNYIDSLTAEDMEGMKDVRDARPSTEALRKMVFFAESSLDLKEATPNYFNRYKDMWSQVELTPERIQGAIDSAERNLERADAAVIATAKRDEDIPQEFRMYAAAFDDTALDPTSPAILDTSAGKTMRNNVGEALSHEILIDHLRKAKEEGYSDAGEFQFENLRSRFTNLDQKLIREMTVQQFVEGSGKQQIKELVENRSWADLLEVDDEGREPTAFEYAGGVAQIPFRMMANVPRQMIEYAGLLPIVAKSVVVDPITGAYKDLKGIGEDIGGAAFEAFKDPYQGREQIDLVPADDPALKIGVKPEDLLVEDVLAKTDPTETSEFAKEVQDIGEGATMMVAGLIGAGGELLDTVGGMATGDEKAYKTFVNFGIERPLDLGAIAAIPLTGARAATASAITRSRAQAAQSAAAYDRAAVTASQRGGRLTRTQPVTAEAQAAATEEAARTAGRVEAPATLSEKAYNLLNRGVSKEALEEAATATPKDATLNSLYKKAVADQIKVKALEQKYQFQTNAIKYADPASWAIESVVKTTTAISPQLMNQFRRRSDLLSETKVYAPDTGESISVLDIVARTNGELAERILQNDRMGNAIPEEALREVDDILRESPELSGVDAYIILSDDTHVSLPQVPKEPELNDIFGRELSKQEQDNLIAQPEKIQQQVRENGNKAKSNIDKAINNKLNQQKELGLLAGEAAHLHSMMDYADFLRGIRDLPTTYQGMQAADRASLKQSFVQRRQASTSRADVKDTLMRMVKSPKGMPKEDVVLLKQIISELSDVSHEWGARRGINLIDEAADTFDAVNQSVDLLANKLTGKKKKAVKKLIKKARKADKQILDIDKFSVDVLDRYYRSELLDATDASLFGTASGELRQLSQDIPMTVEQRALINEAVDQYEAGVARFKAAEDSRRTKRIKKKERKRQTKKVKEEARAVREELQTGKQQADVEYQAFSDEVRQELGAVKAEIVDAIKTLDERQQQIRSMKATRLERAQAMKTIEQARKSGGGGNLIVPSLMLKNGMVPKAVPAKHISLAQAVSLMDNLDDNTKALQAQAFKMNGLDVARVGELGPDALNYLRWVDENYGSAASMSDAVVTYSARPLFTAEDVVITELKGKAKRTTNEKITAISDRADLQLGGPAGSAIKRYDSLKKQGLPIPKQLQKDVDAIVMTAASDIRTEVFRTTGQAINEGLLNPEIAKLRIATYFPDLYQQFEESMRYSIDDAIELGIGDEFRPIINRQIDEYKLYGNNFRYSKHKLKSLEEKRDMGLIDDPAAVFVVGMNRIQNDIITARMYRQLRESTFAEGPYKGMKMAMTEAELKALPREQLEAMTGGAFPQWKKIPGKEVEVIDPTSGYRKKNTKRLTQNFGELGGVYVPTALYDDLVQIPQTTNRALHIYRKLLSGWKVGKTSYNPVTQTRNHVSNWFVADMNGMLQSPTAWRVMNQDDIVRQAYTHQGELAEEAIAAGLFGSSMAEIELQGALGRRMGMPSNLKTVLRKIERDKTSGVESAFEVAGSLLEPNRSTLKMLKDGLVKADAFATQQYRFGDEFYKLWRYGQIRSLQKKFLKTNNLSKEMIRAFGGQEEALRILNIADPILAKRAAVERTFADGFLDYSRVSAAVNWARKGWSPFVTFSAEMLPKFIERQRQYPIKALLYREMFRNLNNYTERLDGSPTLGDLEEISISEALLPEYMRGKSVYGGQKVIKTARGDVLEHQFWDVGPYTLIGGFQTALEEESSILDGYFEGAKQMFPQLELAMPKEPITDVLGRAILNRNEWSNHSGQLFREDATIGERTAARLELAANKLLPSLAGRALNKIYSAATGQPYGSRGKMMNVDEALADALVGIRSASRSPLNLEIGLENKAKKAEMVQTPDDKYMLMYNPEEWSEKATERGSRVQQLFEMRQANADKLLLQQLERNRKIDRGLKAMESMMRAFE